MSQREVTLRLTGAAGQGIKSAATILGKAITRSGWYATCHTEVESRVRGGINFHQFTVSLAPCMGIKKNVDILIALTEDNLEASMPDLAADGVVLSPEGSPKGLNRLAREAGSPKVIGTVGLAAATALLGIPHPTVEELVKERFSTYGETILENNLKALDVTYEVFTSSVHRLDVQPNTQRLWLGGHEALSLGAIAGGVTFMAAYPMSPATGCLTDLASWAKEVGVVTVQVEDEVAAINMVAGASYAGARAMTSTSGGGFALMTEGLSLIGEVEAPAVIVLAQRPGPATGMATRTAQEDLYMAAYGGHGFFPRIILAPRDIADCFQLGAKAFDLAEKYQVPVFLMTDQLLQDSSATIDHLEIDELPTNRYYLEAKELEEMKSYSRYAFTDNGISPMAAPGSSRHTVMVDSHIHDEDGHLTEDPGNAAAMADKLQRKNRTLKEAAFELEVIGELDNNPLVITWGSTYATTARAIDELNSKGKKVSHLNLRWLWPPPREALCEILEKCGRAIVVENSANGIFADYIEHTTGFKPDAVINKMNGRPFAADEIVQSLAEEVV